MIEQYPQISDIHFWAQFPGESVEAGDRRLEIYCGEGAPPAALRNRERHRIQGVARSFLMRSPRVSRQFGDRLRRCDEFPGGS